MVHVNSQPYFTNKRQTTFAYIPICMSSLTKNQKDYPFVSCENADLGKNNS
jgi:hypothetical protein